MLEAFQFLYDGSSRYVLFVLRPSREKAAPITQTVLRYRTDSHFVPNLSKRSPALEHYTRQQPETPMEENGSFVLGSSSGISLHINIGQFLLILVLVKELVLRPMEELFKDQMVFCAARSVVADGNPLRIRSAPFIFRAFGIERFLSGGRSRLVIAQLMRIALMVLLIAAASLFESSIDTKRNLTVSRYTTAAVSNDGFDQLRESDTILLSPFPAFSLNEEEAANIAAFEPSGTNSSSNYAVREDSNIASQFISSCIRQTNDSFTVVYVGALIRTEDGLRVMCLDGSGNSANRTAATFVSNSPKERGLSIQMVTLSSLQNEDGFSSDFLTGVFAASVVDENDVSYEGYVAVSKKSHFDSNVVWSMYGMVRRDGSSVVWRLNIRLYNSGGEENTEFGGLPCFDENPSLQYIGNWTFDGSEYVCPDGVGRPMNRLPHEELQTASLQIFPVSDRMRTADNANGDLLAWLIETDYARFVSSQTFALELRRRIRADRFFYSSHSGENVTIVNGGFEDVVVLGVVGTTFFITSIGGLLAISIASSVWKWWQAGSLKMDSEVASFEAVSAMYRSDIGKTYCTDNTILEIALSETTHDTQRLGILKEGKASKRIASVPLE